ncbi:MAG: glutaredoxin 3, partial [Candidatus Binataceae bacterium]
VARTILTMWAIRVAFLCGVPPARLRRHYDGAGEGRRRAIARVSTPVQNHTAIRMAKVQVYTTLYCPFCVRAKMLLKSKGVEFEEIDVSDDSELRAKLVEMSGGRRTVPEIFINGEIVGGYEELRSLDARGELDRLLT